MMTLALPLFSVNQCSGWIYLRGTCDMKTWIYNQISRNIIIFRVLLHLLHTQNYLISKSCVSLSRQTFGGELEDDVAALLYIAKCCKYTHQNCWLIFLFLFFCVWYDTFSLLNLKILQWLNGCCRLGTLQKMSSTGFAVKTAYKYG